MLKQFKSLAVAALATLAIPENEGPGLEGEPG